MNPISTLTRTIAHDVSPDSYLIVEGTNNGHPADPDFGPGPAEALEEFLREAPSFRVDRPKERLYLRFNPGGYLTKIR